jgi:hypothetical protein
MSCPPHCSRFNHPITRSRYISQSSLVVYLLTLRFYISLASFHGFSRAAKGEIWTLYLSQETIYPDRHESFGILFKFRARALWFWEMDASLAVRAFNCKWTLLPHMITDNTDLHMGIHTRALSSAWTVLSRPHCVVGYTRVFSALCAMRKTRPL